MGAPVGIGMVGLGWWGGRLAQAVAASQGCRLVSCYARTPASRERFAAAHGCATAGSYEALLADDTVDAVFLATPHSTHADLIARAAAQGVHVFVEKPLTLTVAEGTAALRAAEAAGIVLQVGHNRRRQAPNRRINAMIAAGELGMVHLLSAHICVPKDQTPRVGWRSDPAESPVGGMTALGVHVIDTFRYLAGPISRVSVLSKQLWAASRLDDVTVIAMEFARGPLGQLATSLVLPRSATTTVMGTAATAWNEGDGARLYVQPVDADDRHEVPVEPVDPIVDEVEEFARCITDGARPETGGPEALEVVAVLEAIVASAATGQPADVRDFRG